MTVITVERAIADGITPGQLINCAKANEKPGYPARRFRNAKELRRVAAQLAADNDNRARRVA